MKSSLFMPSIPCRFAQCRPGAVGCYCRRPHTPPARLLSQVFGKRQLLAACAPSLLPHRTNAIFICSGLQSPKLPPGTSGYFSPPFEPLNTMSFMPRGSASPTMWRICSLFCAWILLFLAEVCAQTQRRYTFYSYFYCLYE